MISRIAFYGLFAGATGLLFSAVVGTVLVYVDARRQHQHLYEAHMEEMCDITGIHGDE